MSEENNIRKILEEVATEICDKYCRYPHEPIPEGRDDDWMIDDICPSCPLNRLT